ncbi:MAG: copper amine oxidase N-terminal domain-containing protein [Defluviitaleaceae bacterium]|nr:copper amine oxidase N-terminal domain-containing protein [Defluviitaleaceae bacterium]
MKKFSLLLLLVVLAFVVAACGSDDAGATNANGEPMYEDVSGEDVDWSQFPIIINGQRGVRANWFTAPGQGFPTHIPLIPVAAALDATVHIEDSDPQGVRLNGLNGSITFHVGSNDFNVAGQNVELWQPSILVDGEIYVPIAFFRDVFGMGQAAWISGHVHIDTEASDMM